MNEEFDSKCFTYELCLNNGKKCHICNQRYDNMFVKKPKIRKYRWIYKNNEGKIELSRGHYSSMKDFITCNPSDNPLYFIKETVTEDDE